MKSALQIIRQRSRPVLLLCTLALTGALAAHAAMPPGVSNIRAAQRPGTKLVDIQYDLNPVGGSNVPISILVSSNSGGVWDVPARTFVGDYGASVSPGSNKWVVWNAGADWNGQYTANCRVRVLANGLDDWFVLIPAGSYQRGNVSGDSDIFDAPVYSVYVSAFYMSAGEVTGSRWSEVYQWATNHGYVFSNPGASKALNHPTHTVTWYDCVKWCNARSEMEGRLPCYYTDGGQMVVYRANQLDLTNGCVKWSANGYRLPTEAEWEKAARGGLTGKRFAWGDRINESLANYLGHPYAYSYDDGPEGYIVTYAVGVPYTSPAGAFPPNSFGLYDMAGNVGEWCWDWYSSGYYASGQTDPRGPDSPMTWRLSRGGGWNTTYASGARCAFRRYVTASACNAEFGFRCVRGF